MLGVALCGALGLSLWLSTKLQRIISDAAAQAHRGDADGDARPRYHVRVEKSGDDEIGELIGGFNAMLGEIQDRDGELLRHQEQLERTVDERTAELRAANTDLIAAVTRPSKPAAPRASSWRT